MGVVGLELAEFCVTNTLDRKKIVESSFSPNDLDPSFIFQFYLSFNFEIQSVTSFQVNGVQSQPTFWANYLWGEKKLFGNKIKNQAVIFRQLSSAKIHGTKRELILSNFKYVKAAQKKWVIHEYVCTLEQNKL